jgi:hypothetical protein
VLDFGLAPITAKGIISATFTKFSLPRTSLVAALHYHLDTVGLRVYHHAL